MAEWIRRSVRAWQARDRQQALIPSGLRNIDVE
jgi:hypothetical protein